MRGSDEDDDDRGEWKEDTSRLNRQRETRNLNCREGNDKNKNKNKERLGRGEGTAMQPRMSDERGKCRKGYEDDKQEKKEID